MKRFISLFLIIAYVHSNMGCMKWVDKNTLITDKNDIEIAIQKRDSVAYFFAANTYKFKNDTLYGIGHQIIGRDKNQELDSVKIAINDVMKIKIKEHDTVGTILLIGVTISVGLVIYTFVWSVQNIDIF